jgi:hypothetical protein
VGTASSWRRQFRRLAGRPFASVPGTGTNNALIGAANAAVIRNEPLAAMARMRASLAEVTLRRVSRLHGRDANSDATSPRGSPCTARNLASRGSPLTEKTEGSASSTVGGRGLRLPVGAFTVGARCSIFSLQRSITSAMSCSKPSAAVRASSEASALIARISNNLGRG